MHRRMRVDGARMGAPRGWLQRTAIVGTMVVGLSASAGGPPPPSPPSAPGAPPSRATEVMASILADNNAFVSGKSQSFFTPFKDAQHPRATVVMCADSRVHTHAFENTPDGDLFVVRNIGNQVLSNRGSVEYGVRHLHTPVLLIIGHVACGAVKAALGDYRSLSNDIREPLDRLHLALDQSRKQPASDQQWRAGIEENVHYQVTEALTTYAEEVKSGKLVVVGAVYDFQDVYGLGRGRLVLLNVNGERDPRRIPNTPLIAQAVTRSTTAPPPAPPPAPTFDAPVTAVASIAAEPGGTIRVRFNEAISPQSVVPTSFASRERRPGTITVTNQRGEHELALLDAQGTDVIITPFEVLQGSRLVVTVSNRVTDLRGNPLPRPVQATVTTLP
jgi:carbonic anhydrase